MSKLLAIFKLVSIIFAFAAIGTGAQAIFDPIGFSRSFGISLDIDKQRSSSVDHPHKASESYVSLMGVRQLGTGVILLTFAFQDKWIEMATILTIIGILVAGTDAIYLSRSGAGGQARFHAIPGGLIALLAATVLIIGQ